MEGRIVMSASPIPKRQPQIEPCSLTHDLINDLAIIMGECDLLDGSLPEGVATQRLQVIRAATRRMAERIAYRPCPLKADMGSSR